MRSEPVTPVQTRTSETRRDGEATAPADGAMDAFEASLRRAGRGRYGLGDEAEARDAPADSTPQGLQAAPVPASPRVEAPPTRWAPLPVTTPDAATRQLKAQALPDIAPTEPDRWQLQITETGLPVQRLDLQRSPAGPVTVLVSALAEAQQPRHTARLRERLAARGTAQVDFRGPSNTATDSETSSS